MDDGGKTDGSDRCQCAGNIDGMYTDAVIIYREYIQNACDAIEQALREGLLSEKREGRVHICLDPAKRCVSIEDNGAGVPSAKFRSTVGDIANSAKDMMQDKGFRGIGRLAGLAYCRKLVFSSTAVGESTISRLICDAERFCAMLDEKGRFVGDVLEETFTFSAKEGAEKDAHFFKVEMQDVSKEGEALLDKERIHEYLSLVAPVPFDGNFYQRNKIYDYARKKKYPLDEYRIILNATPISKAYRTNYLNGSKKDSIRDVSFRERKGKDGKILAWLWYALTGFLGSITGKDRSLSEIRLRSGNIQIGDEDALRRFFKEERFSGYVIGELHVLPTAGLRPNARRDYFNSSAQLAAMEEAFRLVAQDLGKICRAGSDMNTLAKSVKHYEEAWHEHMKKVEGRLFLDEQERAENAADLEIKKKSAEDARKKLESIKTMGTQDGISAVDTARSRIAAARLEELSTTKSKPEGKVAGAVPSASVKTQKHPTYRTDKLSTLSKKERKLVDTVYRAVKEELKDDKEMMERVISAIEAALQ